MSQEVILVLSAWFTATVSGTLGMAGGILLLTIMAQFFPVAILIPLHGIIQLSSNLSRTFLHFRSVDFKVTRTFAIGSVLGAAVGSQMVTEIPETPYRIGLAIFILVATWMPKLKSVKPIRGKFFFVGLVSSFLSLFVGATGPLIAPFYIRESFPKEVLVATKAACQVFIHLFKVTTYFVLGFALSDYAVLAILMIAATFLGNYCGKLLLGRISETGFRMGFKIVITLLAIRLVL